MYTLILPIAFKFPLCYHNAGLFACMCRIHITVQLHHCPVQLHKVQSVSGHAICVIVKVLQSAHIRNYNTL